MLRIVCCCVFVDCCLLRIVFYGFLFGVRCASFVLLLVHSWLLFVVCGLSVFVVVRVVCCCVGVCCLLFVVC